MDDGRLMFLAWDPHLRQLNKSRRITIRPLSMYRVYFPQLTLVIAFNGQKQMHKNFDIGRDALRSCALGFTLREA